MKLHTLRQMDPEFILDMARLGGFVSTWVNGQDHQIDHNVITNEGMLDMLAKYLRNGSPPAAWYMALFSGNVTPAASLTAATFNTTTTEFVSYEAATRVLWAADVPAANAIANAAVPASFTMSTGVSAQTLYGLGLLSVSTKAATTGVCFSAVRFATPRTGLNATDVLTVQYTINGTST